jgi:hypothetical protein
MTVVNVHPDSASLEYHMELAGPLFRRFVELVTLSSIHIYGEPSEKAWKQAHEKARLLGGGTVEVEALHAGFTRLAAGGRGGTGVSPGLTTPSYLPHRPGPRHAGNPGR